MRFGTWYPDTTGLLHASATTCLLWAVLAVHTGAHADDWPHWLGPKRDSVWREAGIVDRFPPEGLPVRWRVPVDLGYTGPAVAEGRVYLMDYTKRSGTIRNAGGTRDKLEGMERVLCFAADTGKLLWKHEYDRPYHFSFGGGPRCTPTMDSGKVYALGAEGNLWCLNAETGNVVWSKDFVKDYGGKTPLWGVAAHPLVDGDALYCLVGGDGCEVMAFDKHSGEEIWRAMSMREHGYCPPTMIEHGASKELLVWDPEAVHSLEPRTGKVHWSVPLKPGFRMSIAAPRLLGSHLFVSGARNASVLLRLGDTAPAAEVVWRGAAKVGVSCSNSTPFLEGGMIYGCDDVTGALMGVRLSDGKRLWQTTEPTCRVGRRPRYGTAFLVKHEDRFFLFSETGDLILARLSPEGYDEISRFHVLEPTSKAFGRFVLWSHPAFADKCLWARNDKELVCVSLAAGDSASTDR